MRTFDSIDSLFSLSGKTAVLTGATGYFGRAFAETLLFAGAAVRLFGRSEAVSEMESELAERYGSDRVASHRVDCSDDQAFRAELARAEAEGSGVDILVNNAFEFSRETGFNHPSGRLEAISREQWLRGLESGVYWHAAAIQVIGEAMRGRGQGSIVNVSSMYALVSPDPELYRGRDTFNPPTYSASKAALLAFTRYVASFYGESSVRCNSLLPGAFPNTDPASYNAAQDPEFMDVLARRTVLGRTGNVDDLKGALLFLTSDASRYMTGQALVVDGGWTVR